MKKLLLISSFICAALGMSAQNDILVNPMTMLQGAESGLYVSPLWNNINLSPDIYMRGTNTLRIGGGPLWVVDGITLNDTHLSDLNPLSFLNPYDIESIEVLKNVSRTSVYGGRGSDGVIIINTGLKKNKGFGLTYNGNAGVTLPMSGVNASRTGCVTNHSVSMSGQMGKTFYGASGFYTFNQGAMKFNDNSTGGLRVMFDTKANSLLWLGSNTSCAIGKMTSSVPGEFLEDWSENYNDDAQERRVTNYTYLTFNIKDNLKFKLDVGIDFQNTDSYLWAGKGTEEGDLYNGSSFVTSMSQLRYDAGAELSWFRYFNDRHKVSVVGAFDLMGGNTDYNCTGGSDFFSHYLRAKGIGLAASDPFINKYKYSYLSFGAYADVSYNYNGIVGIDVLARIDNTPRYDGSRVRLYKSANAYWDIRKSFFPASKAVSALRLEVGYGDAGKESPAPYGMYPLYIPGDYPKVDGDYQMFYSGLSRTRSAEYNISLSAEFLEGRLMAQVGYYDRLTNDSFLSYCFGVDEGHYWRYGEGRLDYKTSSIIANRGFEADVKAEIFDNKIFGWTLSANASYNLNQLLEVAELDANPRKDEDELVTSLNVLGHHVGSYFGYRTDASGNLLDLTDDGVLNDYDKVLLGNPLPEYYGGLGSSFRIGDFNIDLLCSWAGGFDMLDLSSLYGNETAPYVLSDKYVVKGDYFSLSKVSASYRFDFKKKGFFKGLTVRMSGLNLIMTNRMYKSPKGIMAGLSIHI